MLDQLLKLLKQYPIPASILAGSLIIFLGLIVAAGRSAPKPRPRPPAVWTPTEFGGDAWRNAADNDRN